MQMFYFLADDGDNTKYHVPTKISAMHHYEPIATF